MPKTLKVNKRCKMTVKRGDIVQVISGSLRWKGTRGRVLKVLPKENRLIVEGIKLVWKHQRPSRQSPSGGRISKLAPIHRSNVMLVCPHCQKPTRIKIRFLDERKKVRSCKRCNEIVDPI